MNQEQLSCPIELAFSLRQRDRRDELGLFLTEGVRALCRARNQGLAIQQILVYPKELNSPRGQILLRQLKREGVPVLKIKAGPYRSLIQSSQPQGVIAILEQQWRRLDRVVPRKASHWLLVRHIRSPGNFGSMLRTAEASGVSGVILLGTQTDPYNPGTVRAAMGSLLSLPFSRANHHEIAQWTFKHRARVYGCSGTGSKPYNELTLSKRPTLLFLGEERRGLSERDRELCDDFLSIPMTDKVDSLNVSVATGIILFEIYKQRGFPGRKEIMNSG